MIVADASAVIEFLNGTAAGRAVEAHLVNGEPRIQAPALLDAEVAQVFRRMGTARVLEEGRARANLEILTEMPVQRYLLTPLLPRIWQLRESLTAYDGAYVALAEALGCPLLTFDQRIAQAPGHTAEVIIPRVE